MNDELNKEGTSDSLEDEPASLRVENEVNDDNKVDTSSKEEVVSKKKNKMAINYGIVSSILIISSILTFFVTEEFLITPFVLGVCILGMTWYSVKRKRDCSDEGIIFYSHSQIIYYWPIWLGAFLVSDLAIFGIGEEIKVNEVVHSFAPSQFTMLHLIVTGLVIFFTTVNLRGVWAIVFAVTALAAGLTLGVLDWWGPLLKRLGNIELYVNSDFYRALGAVVFLPWLFVVFIFDLRRYFHFQPSQITMVREIGEGEKNFDSFGVVMEKHRDNFVQHIALGFGSGDLSISTHGGDRDTITFQNVWRIGKVLKEIARIREMRG